MSRPVRAILALDGAIGREELEPFLPGGDVLEIVGTIDGERTTAGPEGLASADVLLVASTGQSDGALEMIRMASDGNHDRPVIVLCEGSPNGFLRRAFDAGADDVVVLADNPENIRFALEKAAARKTGARLVGAPALAPMICVLGPKGGTGKTLTASNLAASLAAAGHRPVVVDLDLQFGDVGLALGLNPDKTVYDLARSGGALDAEKLEDYLTEHESGARVLLAPVRPDQASAVKVEFLREVWQLLRSIGDYVVVDTPPEFTPEVIAAIDASSDVCMVGMLDSLSVKNMKLGLETLDLMGYDPDRIKVVLNRADSRVGISTDDVARVLGRMPDVLIPSDRDVPRAVNEGQAIALQKPRSGAAAAFRSLAQMYAPPPAKRNGRRGRLRLRRRKG